MISINIYHYYEFLNKERSQNNREQFEQNLKLQQLTILNRTGLSQNVL